jgi:hypothetical protein
MSERFYRDNKSGERIKMAGIGIAHQCFSGAGAV